MSVTVIGLDGFDGTFGAVGDRSQTLTYKSVASASPSTDHHLVVTAAVVAFASLDIGNQFPYDSSSYCKKIRSVCKNRYDRAATVWMWETTYTFSSETSKEQDGGAKELTRETDPTARAPRIAMSAKIFERPVSIDIDAKRVENSAGDPFVRTEKFAHLVYRWGRTMRSWSLDLCKPVQAGGYLLSRNAATWSPGGPFSSLFTGGTVPIGGAQMQRIDPEIRFEDGGCVDVDVEIHVDTHLHKDRVIDQGFFHLAAAGVYTPGGGRPPSEARQRFRDRNGVAAAPQNLNGAGRPLAFDAAPVTLEFQYYALKNWEIEPWGPSSEQGMFFGPVGAPL